MRTVRIERGRSGDQGTPGYLSTPGFFCATLELPWRDNTPNISCISQGIYRCRLRKSPRFGWCYHVTDVYGRTWILTHSGNVAGDRSKGYLTHTNGCILQGKYHGKLGNQRAVLVSKTTVRRFIEHMDGQDFYLTILDHWEGYHA